MKHLLYSAAIIVIICLIGTYLFPYLAWLLGLEVSILPGGICFIALALAVISGIASFKNKQWSSSLSIFLATAVAMFAYLVISGSSYRGKFYDGYVLIEDNPLLSSDRKIHYGLANKFGVTIIPKSYQGICITFDDESGQEEIIAIKFAKSRNPTILEFHYFSDDKLYNTDQREALDEDEVTDTEDYIPMNDFIEQNIGRILYKFSGWGYIEDYYVDD